MFRRNSKTIIAGSIAVLLVWVQFAQAAWLCTATQLSFDTEDECNLYCTGTCVGSDTGDGYWACGSDVNGDGTVSADELQSCTQAWTCPLGASYTCDASNQCSAPGTCSGVSTLIGYICSGGAYSLSPFSPSEQTVCEATCGFIGESCVPLTSTSYNCSITGTNYATLSECRAACVRTANCTFSGYQCPDPTLQCTDLSSAASYSTATPNLTYYQDDGTVNSTTGQCLGQIYIFGGSAMMCRPSGWGTHFHDCCDPDADTVNEIGSQLSLLQNTFGAISKIKDAVEVAQQAVELYNVVGSFSTVNTDLVTEAGNFLKTADAAKEAVSPLVQGGTLTGTATGAAAHAVVNLLASAVPGMVLAAIVNFAIKWALSGCEADDIMTAAYDELGLCHYEGETCINDSSLLGCLQKAKVFCCFNSKLARIIHEQARPQLQNFGPGGAWGTAAAPNCRGFTPEEFQMIDFSKIDLSEWYSDIKTRTQEEIQQNAQQNLENFRNNIR